VITVIADVNADGKKSLIDMVEILLDAILMGILIKDTQTYTKSLPRGLNIHVD